MKSLNPGNINVRLGALMALEEQAMAAGELETAANIQGMEADYLSVFMSPKEWNTFAAMPGITYDTEETKVPMHQDAAALGERRRYLLKIARDNNVFARGEVLEGDASSLDDLIEEARP